MEDYTQLFNLTGKTALIIGGTGGLGKAICSALMQNGAKTVVSGLHPEKVSDLEAYAQSRNSDFLAIKADILDSNSIDALINEVLNRFGRIDILVNSAGINVLKNAENYDEETWDRVMDVNVKGTHLVTKAVGKVMIKQNYGRIVNISSVRSILGMPKDYLAYCTSKGAVNMYTKQIACEWAKYNITCNAIAPTFVRTPINEKQLDNIEFYNKLVSRIPLGRIGQEKDIAAAAVYLCSDAASFVTGQILGVDGGLTVIQ